MLRNSKKTVVSHKKNSLGIRLTKKKGLFHETNCWNVVSIPALVYEAFVIMENTVPLHLAHLGFFSLKQDFLEGSSVLGTPMPRGPKSKEEVTRHLVCVLWTRATEGAGL